MNILVIDSGYGGLPVLNALKKSYPQNNYTYIADTKNFPYGTKTIEEIKEIINRIELKVENVDKVYFACNTLSSIFYFNEKYDGVIKPIVEYVNKSNYNKVLLIATKNTIDSNIYQEHLNCIVETRIETQLIYKIENQLDYSTELEILRESISNDTEAIILGCTHFLLIKNEIKELLNIDVICVDELI